ncbi:hypothetical protein DB88DRAFT_245434 [Papiliotrema laurentii]|uniref:Uncharacterized protein n=1 Tax=Papiliotrema laurentii TaxID=5418 RepID=A0AAD9L619_PAPLA|nr:hypothetical protein DB88DRAFT_245434 [Papiliotrema laurentii]
MTILSHPHPTTSKETSSPHFTPNTTASPIRSPIPLTNSQLLPITIPSPVIAHDIPYTTRLTFFPPYDSPPHIASSTTAHNITMTTTDPIVRHPTPWVRPTACDIPNPPRKRTTPIRLASNAFHPNGWSPPPSLPTYKVDLGKVTHNISLESPTGPPAVVYAPVATAVSKVIHASSRRTEPITFAANSFDPTKRSAPLTPSTSSSTLETDDGNDEVLLSPSATGSIPRPPAPARRRTDPIGFAVNGWRIDVPAIPLQVDTRVCSPPASPTNTFDWSPVYAKPPQKENNPLKPCTKWMTRAVASSHGPTSPPPGLSEKTPAEDRQGQRQVPLAPHHVRARCANAVETAILPKEQPSNGPATSPQLSARKSSEGQGSSWSQYKFNYGPISPRLNAAQQVAHEEAMSEELEGLVLEELVVSEALHPKITMHPRPASPHLPDLPGALVEGFDRALQRKDTVTSSTVESVQRSAAEYKLAEILSRQRSIASPKHLLEMDQLRSPQPQAEDPGK